MNKMRIIIFGAPGSGKGTISERIVKNFVIKHISSGDILRKHIHNKTDLGKSTSDYVSAGKLVPDSVINSVMLNEIKGINDSESCLLDGYPRTLTQAEQLSKEVDIHLVINLVVPQDVIIERLRNRWIHLSSGRVYNIGFNDPKVPGLDDVTGEKLVQREDDTPAVVKKRLITYSETSSPVIEFFDRLGLLKNFEGNTSNEIWSKLYQFLCPKLEHRV